MSRQATGPHDLRVTATELPASAPGLGVIEMRHVEVHQGEASMRYLQHSLEVSTPGLVAASSR